MSHLTHAIRLVRHWHARIGVLLAVVLLFLSLTGLALSHTDALGLDKRQINTDWLMRWYGLHPTVPSHGFLFKGGYLAAADGRWVMDGRVLSETGQTPVGAVSWGGLRGLASAGMLYLYLPDGRLVDKLTGSALPGQPIKRLGSLGARLVIETAQGSYATDDGLNWQPLAGQPIWSVEQYLPDSLSISLRKAFVPSLPLERIILDLHSGRIFGRYGPMLMDIAAIVLIVLSLSGMWIYLRTIRRKPK
ncbi:MAG: PepSY domain-containing protein [Methylophilaceae bacterium]